MTGHCVIIGGGPAGMVAGLLLARAGVRVTVLEKHADFLRDFRGDTVHPSTLALLDDLGLGDRFDRLPQYHITEIAFPAADGPVVIGDLSRLKVRRPYIAMVPQWDLLNLLAGAAREEPGFTLRMRTEVTGLIHEGGRIAGVRYRTAGGQDGEIRADLTLACDGRWSLARRGAGLRVKEYGVPFDVWWFRLPRDRENGIGALVPRVVGDRLLIVLPRETHFQVGYLGPKGHDREFRARGLGPLRREIAAAVPALAGEVDELTSMDDVKHLDVRLNRLTRWHADGLLCIGDAAHAMSPVGGVGINLAVQDAVAAATLLAGPLRKGRPTPAALARVRARRLMPTVAVQTLQRLLHRAFTLRVIQGTWSGPPRSLVWLMRRFPALSYVPAYLIGVGPRPERAPAFARRLPEKTSTGT
ncbi:MULTISPECIES: FAD-dependent oxidoreductase [Nonomuraea]|uniref:FAD-dependent oxidoreductase n=1 Tax=Nonomuraea ferruginea TaxID=46174 RepID=A0ABT4T6Z7_9ACTN|nr:MULTISPECIES: FAD-dependent oxidoreductase [Nonomuraea]MDA0645272.1 FAD-dependent oxidoreductase [Nonomuraea ferruginea]TXK39359.1 FAD-dependent oxidoreductase [Nonomuraea sp. C10]